MEYAIVNLDTETVVPQRGQSALTFLSLARVDWPDDDGSVAFADHPGHEIPPFRLFDVTFVDSGSGPDVSRGAPVFDGMTVTVERAFSTPTPVPPEDTEITPEDTTRLFRGLGVTPAQIDAAKRDRGKPMP